MDKRCCYVDHIYFRGSTIEEGKCLKDSCITEAHSIVGDSSQNLETWNTPNSLQIAYQFGEYCFQVTDSVSLNLLKQAQIQFYHYQCHKMSVDYMSQWMF